MKNVSVIATLSKEGFSSVITREVDTDLKTEVVRFRGDLDIDDDGANGQHGLPIAYRVDNRGRERLADVGYPRFPDEYSQGLICIGQGRVPKVFRLDNGIEFYASRTALRMPGTDNPNDPAIAVDAEFFPYIVVPPQVRQRTAGRVLGSLCHVINHLNGKIVEAVVADIGPATKDGEGSPALARALGIPDDPLTGGIDTPDIEFIIQVGVPAVLTVNKVQYVFNLQ